MAIKNENVFRRAVSSRNVRRVRVLMKDSLLRDPTCGQFEEMSRFAGNLKGLYDPHDAQEFVTDRTRWDEAYIEIVSVGVLRNFSHERLEHLMQVIQFVRLERAAAGDVAEPEKSGGEDAAHACSADDADKVYSKRAAEPKSGPGQHKRSGGKKKREKPGVPGGEAAGSQGAHGAESGPGAAGKDQVPKAPKHRPYDALKPVPDAGDKGGGVPKPASAPRKEEKLVRPAHAGTENKPEATLSAPAPEERSKLAMSAPKSPAEHRPEPSAPEKKPESTRHAPAQAAEKKPESTTHAPAPAPAAEERPKISAPKPAAQHRPEPVAPEKKPESARYAPAPAPEERAEPPISAPKPAKLPHSEPERVKPPVPSVPFVDIPKPPIDRIGYVDCANPRYLYKPGDATIVVMGKSRFSKR